MKKLLLPLILFSSMFAIYIENVDHLDRHIKLASEKNFNAIGVIYSNKYYGTGTIIHPNVILTAAHVVKDQTDLRFQIVIDGERIDISGHAVYHPSYKGDEQPNIGRHDMPVDVALLFLDAPITEVDYPTLAEYMPPLNRSYYATGYGGWNGALPQYFLDRKLTGLSIIHEVSDDLIIASCINNAGIDLFGTGRPGDSGGPMMTIDGENLIHGVLSCLIYEPDQEKTDGSTNEDPSFTIYPKIHDHIEWILKTIEENL